MRRCTAADGVAPRPGCLMRNWPRSNGALLAGAAAHRFVGELWTLERVGLVIERLTGVRHHRAWVWALLRYRLGWSVQRPVRRAAERDQAAIAQWVKKRWPRILQTPNGAEPAWSSSMSPRSA
jgi:hypothetical protein